MDDFYLKQINRNSVVNIYIYETISTKNLDIYGQIIKTLNYKFPQILFTFGIMANLIQFILYNYKSNRSLNKIYFLALSLTQLVALFCTLANYVYVTSTFSMSAYSKYTCKIFNYLYRSMTDLVSWIAPLLILTTYFSLISKDQLNSNRSKTKWILMVGLILGLVNLIDLFYVELIPIKTSNKSNNLTHSAKTFYICGIRDLRLLILRDIIDLIFYFFLPFCFLFINFYLILHEIKKYKINGKLVLKKSKHYTIMIQRFKMIPLFFIIFNFPILLITFLNYYFNIFNAGLQQTVKNKSSFKIEFFFTITALFNQSHYFLITLINMFYDKFIFNKIKSIFTVSSRYRSHSSLTH